MLFWTRDFRLLQCQISHYQWPRPHVHQFRPQIADHKVSNSLCVFHILFYGHSREQREEKIFHALLKLCFGLEV
jgi:hypothetical protein